MQGIRSVSYNNAVIAVQIIALQTIGKPVHVTALKIFAEDGIRLSRVKINIAVPVKIHLREHIFLLIVGRKHLALTHTADCTARKNNKNFHILTSFIFCP